MSSEEFMNEELNSLKPDNELIKTKLNNIKRVITESLIMLVQRLKKYKKTYDAFQRNSQRKNQLAGMYEDINFKSQSVNISYYIWFILAISGMFLVIKKLKSSN